MSEKIDRIKMIERIKALLALGDSSRNDSEGEVSAAMKKVQELLEKHNLDISEISATDPDAKKKLGEDIVDEIAKEFRKSSMSTWEKALASMVGEATETKPYLNIQHVPGTASGKIVKIRFIGAIWDVAVAKEMYIYLHKKIKGLSIKHYPDSMPNQRNYMEGCCIRLQERIREQNKLFKEQQTQNQGFALMIINKKDAIETYCANKLKLKESRHGSFGQGQFNNEAYQRGIIDANKFDIGNEKRLNG